MVTRPAASASSENLLEMETLSPALRSTESETLRVELSNLCLNKPSRPLWCMYKFKNQKPKSFHFCPVPWLVSAQYFSFCALDPFVIINHFAWYHYNNFTPESPYFHPKRETKVTILPLNDLKLGSTCLFYIDFSFVHSYYIWFIENSGNSVCLGLPGGSFSQSLYNKLTNT